MEVLPHESQPASDTFTPMPADLSKIGQFRVEGGKCFANQSFGPEQLARLGKNQLS
jgi:hypothetical protein